MNDQNIPQAFLEITAQADACRVERKVREHLMKKNRIFVRRPIKATAILAAVLALIMIPAAALGMVYGYRAYHTENGYTVTVSEDMAPIKLDESKMEELGQYTMRFENGSIANIRDFGKAFDTYDALNEWLDGILLTSPMLGGGNVMYCTDDNTGTPIAVHVTGNNTVIDREKSCAVSITIPLADFGTEIGWESRYADMLSSQAVTAENGIETEFVTTETSVTAYFAHGGILYRMSIAGNHEEATETLAEIIGTMK